MNLHGLPSVEQLLQTQLAAELIASYGRPLTLQAIRSVLEDVRARVSTSERSTLPDRENMLYSRGLPAGSLDLPDPCCRSSMPAG